MWVTNWLQLSDFAALTLRCIIRMGKKSNKSGDHQDKKARRTSQHDSNKDELRALNSDCVKVIKKKAEILRPPCRKLDFFPKKKLQTRGGIKKSFDGKVKSFDGKVKSFRTFQCPCWKSFLLLPTESQTFAMKSADFSDKKPTFERHFPHVFHTSVRNLTQFHNAKISPVKKATLILGSKVQKTAGYKAGLNFKLRCNCATSSTPTAEKTVGYTRVTTFWDWVM